jgi:predicted nucleic acid-binding protein
MPSSDLVVSDTSPLLNLALIERLDLLESQFSNVTTNALGLDPEAIHQYT